MTPGHRGLDLPDLYPDPVRQFLRWQDEARAAGVVEPDAMALATATRDGRPSVRMVLLRGIDERGLAFYTNYRSQKGRELGTNPFGALVFWWDRLERQVRVTGTIQRVSRVDSRRYWTVRPRASQISALASRQGAIIASRVELDEVAAALSIRYAGRKVPLPRDWGGYRLVPDMYEFWQGRPDRLHDRLAYLPDDGGAWRIVRLEP